MDVRLYYYHLGESDERKKLNGERVSDLSFKNQTSCFYRLGSLSERHRNHPTRSALLFELTREFCYNCYSSELPNLITVQLNSHYSHRLIKTILDELGYRVSAMEKDFEGFIFTNLVDFDSMYGHRRNPEGYGQAIMDFDGRLPEVKAAMKPGDVLMLCADHGNDPVHSGTDHTREHIPLVVYGEEIKAGVNLGTRKSFADIGATIAEMLGTETTSIGESFAKEILK